ncbi:hypothetical protein BC628DRAFT_277007 [Trametes gibbosa]|nr:hypothetical protein BC628DRAFT_277007 [Trametes gibbosa]
MEMASFDVCAPRADQRPVPARWHWQRQRAPASRVRQLWAIPTGFLQGHVLVCGLPSIPTFFLYCYHSPPSEGFRSFLLHYLGPLFSGMAPPPANSQRRYYQNVAPSSTSLLTPQNQLEDPKPAFAQGPRSLRASASSGSLVSTHKTSMISTHID